MENQVNTDMENRAPMVQREYKAHCIAGALEDYISELEDPAEIPNFLVKACEDLLEKR